MTPFKDLDPILHSQLRLAVISLLMSAESADFTFIQKQTGATAGNLSIQITNTSEIAALAISLCHGAAKSGVNQPMIVKSMPANPANHQPMNDSIFFLCFLDGV